jgi:hypothetical protein
LIGAPPDEGRARPLRSDRASEGLADRLAGPREERARRGVAPLSLSSPSPPPLPPLVARPPGGDGARWNRRGGWGERQESCSTRLPRLHSANQNPATTH